MTETSVWYQKGSEGEKGAQIDLVIDRRDRIINLLEIKFSEHEFEIVLIEKINATLREGRDCVYFFKPIQVDGLHLFLP